MYRSLCEVIAYVGDGEILCDECGEELDTEDEDSPVSPIFLDRDYDVFGSTCGTCGNCYVVDAGWLTGNEACDRKHTRWAKCECGQMVPYWNNGWSYRDARQSALHNKLICPSCHGKMHF